MFQKYKSKLYWLICIWWSFQYFSTFCSSQETAKHVHVCGRTNHNKSTGELMPHNGQIPPNHKCLWHIYPESYRMNEVFLVFETFNLTSSDKCTVSERDGALLFGPFSGNRSIFTILTGKLVLDVSVSTVSNPSSLRNFKAYFSALDCHYEIDEESGSMVSPMYKDIHRSHIVICTWEFKKFKHVELKRLVIFDEFVLKNSSLVVKGSEAQDGIYTGNKSPPNIVAIGNTTFEFHLNTSISGEKFAFTFSVKGSQEKDIDDSGNRKTLCGEISHGGENGTLSPEHGQINAGRSCIWEINCEAIPSTKEIFLSFEEFDLADNDSFTILDITGKIIFGPYSGEKEQFSILTGVKALTAELQISKSLPSFIRRFKVNYNAKVCVNQITAKVGIGICPLYNSSNNRMNENVSCSWLFNLPEDTVQSISFEKFSIPGGQLFVTGNVDPKQSYSGKVHPSDMFIKRTGNITLNFNTLFQNEFLFTYNEVMPECSSYIQLTEENSFAWISSPTYDDSFDGWTNCQWIIQSPGSSVVAFKINRINLTDVQDFIIIKDGNSRLSPLLLQITHNNQETVKNSYLISSHNTMWISFSSQFLIKGSQFQAEVNIFKHGGYYRNNGSITIHSSSLGNDIIYFLEVQNNQQVYLTVSEESFFTSGIVEIYDDFSINASLLTTLRSKKYFYPIVSTSFKMMLVGKNFGQNSSIELNFKGIEKGCHKITLENNGVYSVIGNCNRTCSWIIPPKEQDEKILSFHFFSIALDPMDYVNIYQLDDKMTFVENIKYNHNLMPNIYLPASLGAYLNITRGVCLSSGKESTVFLSSFQTLKSCSSDILIKSGSKIEITSPNFPDAYSFRSHCWTNISRSTTKDFLYLSFKMFHLADRHCVKIHDTKNDKTFVYNNNNANDLLIYSDVALELLAWSCNSSEESGSKMSTGIGYYADVYSTDCGGVFRTLEGSFSTPGFPDKMTGNSKCIWKIEITEQKNNNTAYLIAFSIEWKYEKRSIEVYDGPSLQNDTLTNLTGEVLSKTNSILILYDNNETLSSAFTVHYQARLCSNLCDNGICMHPDWPCNGINQCGDYSDERDCRGRPPLPPPVPPTINNIKTGASYWILAGIPGGFVLGIVSFLAGVFALKKYRERRQNSYSTFPVYD